jgi:phage terminase Nu1 subunit (DNA packaging protein)
VRYQPYQLPPLDQIDPEHLLTADQAAEVVDRQPGTIKQWAKRGKITPIDLGDGRGRLYHHIDVAQAEKWIRDHGDRRGGGDHRSATYRASTGQRAA